jgi:hypothetical protein
VASAAAAAHAWALVADEAALAAPIRSGFIEVMLRSDERVFASIGGTGRAARVERPALLVFGEAHQGLQPAVPRRPLLVSLPPLLGLCEVSRSS